MTAIETHRARDGWRLLPCPRPPREVELGGIEVGFRSLVGVSEWAVGWASRTGLGADMPSAARAVASQRERRRRGVAGTDPPGPSPESGTRFAARK